MPAKHELSHAQFRDRLPANDIAAHQQRSVAVPHPA